MAFSSKNISAGGHVYDRTTGTWVGETRGSFGDGKDHGGGGRAATVIHDANGPVGVMFAPAYSAGQGGAPSPTQQPAVGAVAPAGGGSGPAAKVVNTDGPGSGGAGPGVPGVLIWTEVSGKAPEIPGSFVHAADLPPLLPVHKGSNTALSVGMPWVPNPWFSDADQWEQRMGEPGDWFGGLVVAGADLVYNAHNFGYNYLGPKVGGMLWEMEKRVTAPIPKQEPVDWGQ